MEYREAMNILSCSGLGAVVVSEGNAIVEINETGDRLLHGEGDLQGKSLELIAPFLCLGVSDTLYNNIDFNEYLLPCPAPVLADLPPQTRLIVFRDATKDVRHDMLLKIVNQTNEAVILCDEYSRILLLNDAAVKMDSLVLANIFGKYISSVYQAANGSYLAVPQVIAEKRPLLNLRQQYTTCYGKAVDIVCNNYPIIEDGQTLGGFSVMEDWSKIDELNKQIIDLQGKLLERATSKPKAGNALTAKYQFKDIIHTSPAMNTVVRKCQQIARSDSSVMIYGETGTGKELLTQSIHNASRRAGQPFMAINCAAIPENLLESLLFGTEKGAYTGAERREGFFEQANTGTLFLDEINSMSFALQAKLLRVLQDGMVRRVGGRSEIHVDVRVLSNINIPPYQAIEENRLRRDLFYRLGAVNINIPPLRERKEDIALLAKSFILDFNRKLLKNVCDIDAAALEIFYAYDWPGNVRELQHAIEHAMNILPDHIIVITPAYIPEHIVIKVNGDLINSHAANPSSWNSIMQDAECRVLRKALRENCGNISKTARALGMSRQNLQYRMKKNGIDLKDVLKDDQ